MGATTFKESMESIGKVKPLTREERIQVNKDIAKRKAAYSDKLNGSDIPKDPKEFKNRFIHRYQEITGQPLDVDDENRDVISFLLLYFVGSPLIEKYAEVFQIKRGPQNLSLDKGILLIGCPGSGKTSLFQALSYNYEKPYSVVSCLDIASKFAKGGYESVDQYMKINKNPTVRPYGHHELGWMFDDIGYEKKTKYYGDESLIMEEVLFSHSNDPDSRGKINLSSNLSLPEIEERYGTRVASRMKQMFNVIYYRSIRDRRK